MITTKLSRVTMFVVVAVSSTIGGWIALHSVQAQPPESPQPKPAQQQRFETKLISAEQQKAEEEAFAKMVQKLKADSQAVNDAVAIADPKEKLKTLLKLRRSVLVGLLKVDETHYPGGALYGLIYARRKAILDDILDWADTEKERVALLEELKAAAAKDVRTQEAIAEAGRLPLEDLVQARLLLMEVEIALERARAKAAAGAPRDKP